MSARRPNIYLVGPMGSGKSTIGRRVAEQLGLEFIDCDAELEARTGASVNLIFDIEGEEGFRERETNLLQELGKRRGCLVATGGGTILRERNRKVMKRSGLVVYLRTTVAQQLSRLRLDRKRPLLQAEDREARLNALAQVRNPIYESVADITFPSGSRSVKQAAERLAKAIQSYLENGATAVGATETKYPNHEN